MIDTKSISKIRYNFIENQALKFFESLPNKLLYFPLNLRGIIKCFPSFRLWSYQYFSKKKGITLEDVIVIAESESGCTHCDVNNDRYFITYNNPYNKEYITGRQLFTIAHEIGHIFLGHIKYIEECMIAEKNILYKDNPIFEHEADYFASCIVSPFQIYKDLQIESSKDIQGIFGLSKQASEVQYDSYQRWVKSHYATTTDIDVRRIFLPYINTFKQNDSPQL